jgi:hypothetical protein
MKRINDWFLENKRYAIAFFLFLLVLNGWLLFKRYYGAEKRFDAPVTIGTNVNFDWAKADKELLFYFAKSSCGTCVLYKDSIGELFNKYNSAVEFKGLFDQKLSDSLYFKTYRFVFNPVTSEIRNSIHLAFSPQFVLIKGNKVTFVCNFYSDFGTEFIRLKQYLIDKYGK